MIVSPGMPPMDLGAKASIRSHYDLATQFYRLFWGPHIHHGLWSSEDAVREQPHATPLAAQEALTDAKHAIREIPWERFDVAQYFDADKDATGNKIYVSEGGFIANAEAFDNHFFDISAAEATLIDPQQRLLLDTGTVALYDAGFSKQSLKEARMGVYCGVGSPDFRDLSARDQAVIGPFSATGSARVLSRLAGDAGVMVLSWAMCF